MGIPNGGKQMSFLIQGVHPKEIQHMYSKLHSKNKPVRIDIDVVNTIYPLVTKFGYEEAVKLFVKRMFELAESGFVVSGIMDGENRPDCKRSSWDRRRKSTFADINTKYCKASTSALASSLLEIDSIDERFKVQKEIDKINTERSKISSNLSIEIPHTLKTDIEAHIQHQYRVTKLKNIEGKVNPLLLVPMFQADYLISYRIMNNLSDIVYANDHDYGILLGPKHFIISSTKTLSKSVDDCTFSCDVVGYGTELQAVLKQNWLAPNRIKWEREISYNLLDSPCEVFRALVAIAVGCDVWFGVNGLGALKLYNKVQSLRASNPKNQSDMNKMMIGLLKSKYTGENNLTNEIISTLVSALLNEPVVEINEETLDGDSEYKYLYGKPVQIPSYLSYYIHPEDTLCQIIDKPEIFDCAGIKNITQPHYTLSIEPTYSCSVCKTKFCRTCGYVADNVPNKQKNFSFYKNKKENLCMCCYKNRTLNVNCDGESALETMSVDEMRKVLLKRNHDLPKDASAGEIEQLYDLYIETEEATYVTGSKRVELPLYTTSFFDSLEEDIIYSGPLTQVAAFLMEKETLSDELVPEFLELFASILKYDKSSGTPYCRHVPKIIIEFANRSRSNNDYSHKLIKSAVRHTTDSRAPSILKTKVQLFCHKGDVGIVLENDMPPSMKQEQYFTRIACTKDHLLCCECTCDCSGMCNTNKLSDRVTCVHNLPLLFQLSREFDETMALHFLHHLATRWSNNIDECVKQKGKYNSIRDFVIFLVCLVLDDTQQIFSPSITKLLEPYKESTALPKFHIREAPKSHELTLLRDLNFSANLSKDNLRVKKSDGTCESMVKTKKRRLNELKVVSPPLSDAKTTHGIVSQPSSTTKERIVPTLISQSAPPSDLECVLPTSSPSSFESRIYQLLEKMPPFPKIPMCSLTKEQKEYNSYVPTITQDDTHESVLQDTLDQIQLSTNENNKKCNNVCLLTTENESKVRELWMQKVDESRILVKLGNIEVDLKSFQRLDITKNGSEAYLNDELVNGYLYLIQQVDIIRNPSNRTFIFNSFFMTQLIDQGYEYVHRWTRSFPNKDLSNMEYIVMPVNVPMIHWSLILVELKIKKIKYIDSLGWDGQKYLEAAASFMQRYEQENETILDASQPWTLEDVGRNTPQQMNGHDCGVFLCITVFLLMKRYSLNQIKYTQSDVNQSKSRIVIGSSLLENRCLSPISFSPSNQVTHNSTSRLVSTHEIKPQKKTTNEMSSTSKKPPSSKASRLKKRKQRETNGEEDKSTKEASDVNQIEDEWMKLVYPDLQRFTPDYILVHDLLALVWKKDKIPNKFVGINLSEIRYKKEMEILQRTHKNKKILKRVIKKNETSALLTYRDMISSLEVNGKSDMKNLRNDKRRKGNSPQSNTQKPKSKTFRKCHFMGCNCTSSNTPEAIFHRVPKHPGERTDFKKPVQLENYTGAKLLRQETIRRMGYTKDPKTEMRICNRHEREDIIVRKPEVHTTPKGKKREYDFMYRLTVPKSDGVKNRLALRKSRGVGNERNERQQFENMVNDEKKERIREDIIERESFSQSSDLKIGFVRLPKNTQKSETKEIGNIRPFDISDARVKEDTGFMSKKLLLSYVIIICNGQLEDILRTHSSLNWFEEWYFYFEKVYRRKHQFVKQRIRDYGISTTTEQVIFKEKNNLAIRALFSWPRYASHEEDVALRDKKKWEGIISDNERVVMHDTTGIPLMFTPTKADNQKLTYSSYYHGNYVKCNIWVQLCGLMGIDHLWPAAISDSDYMIRNKIFERQEEFARQDKVNEGDYLPFMNILDRGYRLLLHALRCGKQTVRQPVFKHRDGRRFTGCEMLKSASCASIRSGNERAVRKSKLAGFLAKGLLPGENHRMFDDVLLAWGFQVNFMYAPNV